MAMSGMSGYWTRGQTQDVTCLQTMTDHMLQSGCPFCDPDPHRVFVHTDLLVGLWDAFPVAAGHALLVTRRHVASWFDATVAERQALTEGVDVARLEIRRRHAPDGFSIGVNVGEAAGQTVPHLHVHVIPRYRGDVPDPRRGIRHAIPGLGNYVAKLGRRVDADRYLVTGGDDPLLPHVVSELAIADTADIWSCASRLREGAIACFGAFEISSYGVANCAFSLAIIWGSPNRLP